MIETVFGNIDIGNLIAIIGYIVAFIAGYVKLNEKTRYNSLLILLIKIGCEKCKLKNMLNMLKIDERIDTKFDKLNTLMQSIKAEVHKIGALLAKLTGIILTYMKSIERRNTQGF